MRKVRSKTSVVAIGTPRASTIALIPVPAARTIGIPVAAAWAAASIRCWWGHSESPNQPS